MRLMSLFLGEERYNCHSPVCHVIVLIFHFVLQYNRGSCKGRGAWILGGVCRETGEVFLERCMKNRRDRATLEHIIETHVHKGSRIITDGWKEWIYLNSTKTIYILTFWRGFAILLKVSQKLGTWNSNA